MNASPWYASETRAVTGPLDCAGTVNVVLVRYFLSERQEQFFLTKK
jgi:hypothetical protein